MTRPRILWLLRIAVSAVFGILCLLLIALWWRNFERADWIQRFDSNKILTVLGSHSGTLIYGWTEEPTYNSASYGWTHTATQAGYDPEPWVGWQFQPGLFRLGVSHWLAIATIAALTAAPWIPPRFSLRTLLLTTTLVALVLGLVVSAS
jgi:hypothetical protein